MAGRAQTVIRWQQSVASCHSHSTVCERPLLSVRAWKRPVQNRPVADRQLFAIEQRERTFREASERSLSGCSNFELDFDAFRQRQRFFHINAEVPHRIFDFGVTQKNLNSAQISGRLANDRGLCSSQRMRPLVFASESNRSDASVAAHE